jgi:hypothetical protein
MGCGLNSVAPRYSCGNYSEVSASESNCSTAIGVLCPVIDAIHLPPPAFEQKKAPPVVRLQAQWSVLPQRVLLLTQMSVSAVQPPTWCDRHRLFLHRCEQHWPFRLQCTPTWRQVKWVAPLSVNPSVVASAPKALLATPVSSRRRGEAAPVRARVRASKRFSSISGVLRPGSGGGGHTPARRRVAIVDCDSIIVSLDPALPLSSTRGCLTCPLRSVDPCILQGNNPSTVATSNLKKPSLGVWSGSRPCQDAGLNGTLAVPLLSVSGEPAGLEYR